MIWLESGIGRPMVGRVAAVVAVVAVLTVVGCGYGEEPGEQQRNAEEAETYSVGGTVTTDVEGADVTPSTFEDDELVLQNRSETVTVDQPGRFQFGGDLEDGDDYDVEVVEEPGDYECVVDGGEGTIEGANVTDVVVECTIAFDQTPPTQFDVEIDGDESSLEDRATKSIEVVAEISNLGDEVETREVELEIGDRHSQTRDVELEGGADEVVTFEWETEPADEGEHTAIVRSDYRGDSAPVVVEEPYDPFFEIEIDESASELEIVEEETAVVVASIENTGDLEESRDVELLLGDEEGLSQQQQVELAGGETTTETFEVVFPAQAELEPKVELSTGDDADSADIDVEALPYFEVDIREEATDEEVVANQVATLEVDVKNMGDSSDEQDIELVVDNEVPAMEEGVELEAGGAETLTFQWETDEDDVGNRRLDIESVDTDDSVFVDVLEPPNYIVEIDESSSELDVEAGQEVVVDVEIDNIGEVPGQQDVELTIGADDGSTFSQTVEELEVDGEEQTTETFVWETQEGDSGQYIAEATTEDDSRTAGVDVREPARFSAQIDESESDLEVEEDETVTVTADIENTGEVDGEQSVELAVVDQQGGVVASNDEELEIAGGDDESVALEWGTSDGDAGDYTVEVETDDEQQTAEARVLEPAYFSVEIDGEASDLEVVEEEMVTVDVEVTNSGEVAETTDVELVVDETVRDTEQLVDVGSEETEERVLHWETDSGDAGKYPAEVSTGDETEEVDVTVLEPSFFEVAIDEEESQLDVEETETVVVEATVTNTGEVSGEDDVEMVIEDGGDVRAEKSVEELEIEAQDSEELSLEWETSQGDEGDYEASVETSDRLATESVSVGDLPDSAEFVVEVDESASELEVLQGETALVEATVENEGEKADTQTVELEVDGEVVDEEESLELEGQESEELALAWETDETDAGSYEGLVASEDDDESVDIIVQEPAEFVVEVDESASELEVEETETAAVEIEVENIGDVTDTQTIELTVDGGDYEQEIVDEHEDLELEGGDAEQLTLQWETQQGDGGTYIGDVWASGDVESVDIVVEEPAELVVDIDESESVLEVEETEVVEVVAEVENIGDVTGERDVELRMDETIVAAEELEVDGGAQKTEVLAWETEVGDEGDYEAVVDTGDDTDETTVNVEEVETTLSGVVEDSETGEGLAGVTVVLTSEDALIGSSVELEDETGDEGSYQFEDLEEGEYTLELEASGLEPNYELAEAGGDSSLDLEVESGVNEQDVTLDWLRTTDLVVDGGMLDFGVNEPEVITSTEEDGDDFRYIFEFPGCDVQSNDSYGPVGGGSLRDQIEVTFLPDDECFYIEDVDIELATGDFEVETDDINFPDVEFYIEDHPDDDVESGLVEMQWLFDEIDGEANFVDGSLDVDLDVRMLLGGYAEVPVLGALDFGFDANEYDCQMTGAWGGDIEDPQQDDGEQIGDYQHDPVEVQFTTTVEDGEEYDDDGRFFVAADSELEIGQMSEGQYGDDHPGGASCGENDFAEEDFAEFLNNDFQLPADDGQSHWEFDWWLPEADD